MDPMLEATMRQTIREKQDAIDHQESMRKRAENALDAAIEELGETRVLDMPCAGGECNDQIGVPSLALPCLGRCGLHGAVLWRRSVRRTDAARVASHNRAMMA